MAKLPNDIIEKINDLKSIVKNDIDHNSKYQTPELQKMGEDMILQFNEWIETNDADIDKDL